MQPVALLAEGVDRNLIPEVYLDEVIEVALLAEGVDRNRTMRGMDPARYVALLAEGVDRNTCWLAARSFPVRRPPRGGRG